MSITRAIKPGRSKATSKFVQDWEGPEFRSASFFDGPKDECFEKTVRLSVSQVREWFKQPMIEPRELFPVLKAAGIDFVVLGLYGISGWLKNPRATNDCDVLVPKRQIKLAVKAVCKAFPGIISRDTEVVVRLAMGETVVIDIMKPHHPMFQAALKNTRLATIQDREVKVPTLEMSLALKFFAMTSRHRMQEKSLQDGHDFILLVKNNKTIDIPKAAELGELAYDGAGIEIVKMIRDIQAGRRLEF